MNKIGNVTLNFNFYSGEDTYSDGEIENEILEIFKSKKDITDILAKEDRWPILYHLSPVRRNLLEWIEFHPHSRILEIGAGCGALTGLLCEKAGYVLAVELSKKRAEIIAHRHEKHKNLEIIVGNLNDIPLQDSSFDHITLIGVLEYAALFTQEARPYHSFLGRIKRLLKPSGTLIIAIENKFGLKYWAGANEDHTGKLFDSLEGYPNTYNVRTFGKNELTCLLKDVGFSDLEYYYPIPDYKLPMQIFSDDYLPAVGQVGGNFPNYDMDRMYLFNEKLVFENIIQNNQFPLFSNSFLVICKDNTTLSKKK